MSQQQPRQLPEHSQTLAQAMLMLDLMAHRLSSFYASEGGETAQELSFAAENLSRALTSNLESTQAYLLSQ